MEDKMQNYWFQFEEPPRMGEIYEIKEHPYTLLLCTPYTCRDGRKSFVLIWQTECVDCGDHIFVTTGMSSRFMTKRCLRHRKMSPAKRAKACLKIIEEFMRIPDDSVTPSP